MIRSFANSASEDIFNGYRSKPARKLLPANLWRIAARKLDQLDSAESLEDMKVPPGNRLELLKGDRKGQYSIRINDQYRVCFLWEISDAKEVEIVDYHK
ncbi:MAG: type II toxin-antitoxin system RelE/ParE family toxin [Calditrichia bacterium]